MNNTNCEKFKGEIKNYLSNGLRHKRIPFIDSNKIRDIGGERLCIKPIARYLNH